MSVIERSVQTENSGEKEWNERLEQVENKRKEENRRFGKYIEGLENKKRKSE